MSTALIFVCGLLITAMVIIAMLLIGLSEATNPGASRPEDLSSWEREAVRDKRGDLG
jgi:hypothetical protein